MVMQHLENVNYDYGYKSDRKIEKINIYKHMKLFFESRLE